MMPNFILSDGLWMEYSRPIVHNSSITIFFKPTDSLPLNSTLSFPLFRYPVDTYDRIWEDVVFNDSTVISSDVPVSTKRAYQPPPEVMGTALSPRPGSSLEFKCHRKVIVARNELHSIFTMVHFAELQSLNSTTRRIINVITNGEIISQNLRPVYLEATSASSTTSSNSVILNIQITGASGSSLPPILNAYESFLVLDLSILETSAADVAAITETKDFCKLKRNWMGDPCSPKEFIWDGLNCSNSSSVQPRIISLNLSASCPALEVPSSIGKLKELQYLDLSKNNFMGEIPGFLSILPNLVFLDITGNHFTGPMPEGLKAKVIAGTLELRWNRSDGDLDVKYKTNRKISRTVLVTVASVCSLVVVIAVVILFWCICSRNMNTNSKTQNDDQSHPQFLEPIPPVPVKDFPLEIEQFSYNDLIGMTRKFSKMIGEGAFACVYSGTLGGKQVAVKVLSKASSMGMTQFQNESVLRKLHHKNLVTLVGYCKDPAHLALVYELMEGGSLDDHLSGKSGNVKEFGWKKRLEIAIGSAQGLEYLHEGCALAIVHRDVKPKNILLNEYMEAKLADFGISKIFESNIQKYVSTVVMGTPGYVDPEYSLTTRLDEKSDVYSFGVVLLQLATGKPPIVKTNEETKHLVQWVFSWFEKGSIEEIVDTRFEDKYEKSSLWKLLELALSCADPVSARRPPMSEVVRQLRECLKLEISLGRYYRNDERMASSSTFMLEGMSLDIVSGMLAR